MGTAQPTIVPLVELHQSRYDIQPHKPMKITLLFIIHNSKTAQEGSYLKQGVGFSVFASASLVANYLLRVKEVNYFSTYLKEQSSLEQCVFQRERESERES